MGTVTKAKPKPVHYINNATLHKKVVAYLEACNQAEAAKKTIPRVPDDIARMIILIAERVASKPCYVNYPFREDMVAEAVKNCIEYIRNTDPKRPNVFGYFTQITIYAFWRHIKKEKKALYAKFKFMDHVNATGGVADIHEHGDRNAINNEEVKYGEEARNYASLFVKDYERKVAEQKARALEAKSSRTVNKPSI